MALALTRSRAEEHPVARRDCTTTSQLLGQMQELWRGGHKAVYCTKGKPATEAIGRRRDTGGVNRSATTSTVSSELLEPRVSHLRKAANVSNESWLKLQRTSAAYSNSLGVEAVNGTVGSLFYEEVNMAGVPVKGLIDTGSGATIISFEMFKKIGKIGDIPSSSLYPVDLILQDYNRNPISLGA